VGALAAVGAAIVVGGSVGRRSAAAVAPAFGMAPAFGIDGVSDGKAKMKKHGILQHCNRATSVAYGTSALLSRRRSYSDNMFCLPIRSSAVGSTPPVDLKVD
jgi:hypothetical protein